MVASFFVAVAKLWGLKVNLVKSKGMVVGNGTDAHGLSPVPAGDGFIDLVEDFQYLGSCISRDGELSREVSGCLAKAVRVFGCLHSYILVNKKACQLTLKMCLHCYCFVHFIVWG